MIFTQTRLNKYIYTSKSSKVKESFLKDANEGIKSTGNSGKEILKTQNLKIILAKKTSHVFPKLKGVTPRGWPSKSTWDDVGGISLKNGLIGCFSSSKDNPESTIRHEMGHELDYMFEKVISKNFTDLKGYTAAYLEDFKTLKKKFFNAKIKYQTFEYLTQNSTRKRASIGGKQETFAEIYAKLRGGSAYQDSIQNFDNLCDNFFPNTIAYVKKLLWLLGDKDVYNIKK